MINDILIEDVLKLCFVEASYGNPFTLKSIANVCKKWRQISAPLFQQLIQMEFSASIIGYRQEYDLLCRKISQWKTDNQRLVVANHLGWEKKVEALIKEVKDIDLPLRIIGPDSQSPEMTETQQELVRSDYWIDGRTHSALTAAIAGANEQCVALLLAAGIDHTTQHFKTRVTPLAYAFALALCDGRPGLTKIIPMLLEKSAIPNDFASIVLDELRFQNRPVCSVACLNFIPQLQQKNPHLDLRPFLELDDETSSEASPVKKKRRKE